LPVIRVYDDVIMLSTNGSREEQHSCSLPRFHGAATSQLQRRQGELESDEMRFTVTAASPVPGSVHDLTENDRRAATESKRSVRHGLLDYDGCGPAAECPQVVDATEAQERVFDFEGVSRYSIGEVANGTPPAFHQESALYDRRSVTAVRVDEVGTSSTVDNRTTAGPEHEATVGSAGQSRLHSALQAQCAKLLEQDCHYSYSDVENRLLPHGMCMTAASVTMHVGLKA